MWVMLKRAKAALVIGVLLLATVMLFLLNSVYSVNPPPFHKGVSLSPRSFGASDFSDFFGKAKQAGSVVSWAGDWQELGNENSAPHVVAKLASTYGYAPMIEVQFFSQSTGQLLRPLDEATKQAYLNSAVAVSANHRPGYLALGIEVNVLFEKSPSDFDEFTLFYPQVYDAIKAVSSNTKVFTIFQLEKMKGLNGGLFGGINDPAKAEWALLERFPKNDLISFTTYPSLIFKDPSELPADYYTAIALHTNGPVAITEAGWHTAPRPTGWEGSEAKQANFVTRLFDLASGLNMEVVIWSFLYDQNTIEPFDSMGLWRRDGTPKQAWQAWTGTATTSSETTNLSTSVAPTSSQGNSPRCVIATAAYGSELAGPVQFLRDFRDGHVQRTYLGNRFLPAFNAWYYSWAPQVAGQEVKNDVLRAAVRMAILPLLGVLFIMKQTFTSLSMLNPEFAIFVSGLIASSLIGAIYLTPIAYMGQRLSRRRVTERTFLLLLMIGLILALWGTLGYGSTEPLQILAASLVIETILLVPLAITRKLSRL